MYYTTKDFIELSATKALSLGKHPFTLSFWKAGIMFLPWAIACDAHPSPRIGKVFKEKSVFGVKINLLSTF